MKTAPVTVANRPRATRIKREIAVADHVGRGRVVRAWTTTIKRAIELGDDDAAYRVTVAFVRRLRELGVFV